MFRRIINRIQNEQRLSSNFFSLLHLEFARLFGGKRLQGIRSPFKPNGKIWFRNQTTDYPTLISCFINGFHRPNRPLPSKAVIFDIGANVGFTMIDFKYHYPEARVIGIEMDQQNCRVATRNIESLPDTELLQIAVWHEDKVVSYDRNANADAFSISGGGNSNEMVQAWTIERIMKHLDISFVDYMKLDIEGAEKELLESPNLGWLHQVGQINIELHGSLSAERAATILKANGMETSDATKHWSSIYGWRP